MGVHSRVSRQIANLGNPDYRLSAKAEVRLIDYGKRAVPIVIEACNHEDPQVRFRAVWILGKIADPRGFDTIVRLCDDPDNSVAYDARIALGHTKDPRAVPILQRYLDETDPERDSAISGLAQILRYQDDDEDLEDYLSFLRSA